MLTFIKILLEIIVSVTTVVFILKMHIIFLFECPQYSEEMITLFKSLYNMDIQKPISLDLILYGDSDISYVENITLFNVVPEYIVKNKRFKNN